MLIDDAARLQSTYPGQNADHIKEQQIVVVKQWETLQAAVGERQAALQASIELQKFLSQVVFFFLSVSCWGTFLRKTESS